MIRGSSIAKGNGEVVENLFLDEPRRPLFLGCSVSDIINIRAAEVIANSNYNLA